MCKSNHNTRELRVPCSVKRLSQRPGGRRGAGRCRRRPGAAVGTVEQIARDIEVEYPGQGVAVLRGGDHGAKLAAERRFRQRDGPRVLVCTAAGREGINLQFARVLFNFDLPWNPMDVEQRIGRIHRYGQRDTAQVYNLILLDTIEGRIFLMLDQKLTEIARALGKVDDAGNVAEDLRAQVLGQLSERLNYDRLYQAALSDPELRRTKVELDAALANASEAREVVFERFQDLDGFSLEDYRPFSDLASSVGRIHDFLASALAEQGWTLRKALDGLFEVADQAGAMVARFTDDRERAIATDGLGLLGLDHPLVASQLAKWRSICRSAWGPACAMPAASLLCCAGGCSTRRRRRATAERRSSPSRWVSMGDGSRPWSACPSGCWTGLRATASSMCLSGGASWRRSPSRHCSGNFSIAGCLRLGVRSRQSC